MKEKELEKYVDTTLYRILCLDENATQRMIKENFRKMSPIYHPDTSGTPHSNDEFIKLRFAYDVLSNAGHRKKYDDMRLAHKAAKDAVENKLKQEQRARQAKEEELKKKETSRNNAKPKV